MQVHAQPGTSLTETSGPLYLPTVQSSDYLLEGKSIPVIIEKYGDRSDFICVNLHANETASVEAARRVLEKTGGILIRINNNRQRLIRFTIGKARFAFDPNRMYTRDGIRQTLAENSRVNEKAAAAIEGFAQHMLDLLADSTACVVALHNNTEGAFSIKSYLAGGERFTDARQTFQNPEQDIDDIVLTTDSLLYSKMSEAGYNSIWQHNELVKQDGSLSVYCGNIGRRYINIETQHGKVDQYAEMLERLVAVLEELKITAVEATE